MILFVTVWFILHIPIISSLQPNSSPLVSSSGKKLILIRHGSSEANEFMYRDGNRWGDPNFTDDDTYVDAVLSNKGKKQAESLWSTADELRNLLLENTLISREQESNGSANAEKKVLIVTSPLTRTIQTLSLGLLSHLDKHIKQSDGSTSAIKGPIAQPLATERVYTSSDTGRAVSQLEKEFPHIDFKHCFSSDQLHERDSLEEWWYTHNPDNDGSYSEWRPSDENQFYAVEGEPQHVFDARMSRLFDWIDSRTEDIIVLVTHWGVIRFITEEDDVENCGVRIVDFEKMRARRGGR